MYFYPATTSAKIIPTELFYMKTKSTLLIYLLLCCFFCMGQEQQPVIKIFVKDKATEKFITKASVMLEGDAVAPITAKYNRKGGYYYFNSIPSGYNTVMAYHKKYNEKGFQDVKQLPAELHFLLSKSISVTYNIINWDSVNWEKKKKKKEVFREIFVEDAYKIAVAPTETMGYNEFREYITGLIARLGLQVALVNPYFEDFQVFMVMGGAHNGQNEGYPIMPEGADKGAPELPMLSGNSNLFESEPYANVCFMLRKADATRFGRFNDAVIRALKNEGLQVSVILLRKHNEDDVYAYNADYFRIRDRENKKYNKKYATDSSKVFFYKNQLPNYRRRLRLWTTPGYDLYELREKEPDFVLIDCGYEGIPVNSLGEREYPEYSYFLEKIPPQDKGIGLGILDQFEYYIALLKKAADDDSDD